MSELYETSDKQLSCKQKLGMLVELYCCLEGRGMEVGEINYHRFYRCGMKLFHETEVSQATVPYQIREFVANKSVPAE